MKKKNARAGEPAPKKPSPRLDRRFQPTELRMEEGSESASIGTISHHSPPWDVLSGRLWWEWVDDERYLPVQEVFRRGAFLELLSGDHDVVCPFNHNYSFLLGRKVVHEGEEAQATLRLEEDDTGLRYECDLADTPDGRKVRTLIARGDLRGSSFAFIAAEDHWTWADENGKPVQKLDDAAMILREVHKVDELWDTGPVTFPAYDWQETVSLRDRGFCCPAEASLRLWRKGQGGEDDAKARRERRLRLAQASL